MRTVTRDLSPSAHQLKSSANQKMSYSSIFSLVYFTFAGFGKYKIVSAMQHLSPALILSDLLGAFD